MTNLSLEDFNYHLPDERIAKYPVNPRDSAKLLVWKDEQIHERIFRELHNVLPDNSLMYFNNTKVIPARLYFRKNTGAVIEIFLLNPVAPTAVIDQAMWLTDSVTWKCAIGNLKRWQDNTPLTLLIKGDSNTPIEMTSYLENRQEQLVRFVWNKPLPFAEILNYCGQIPLPPYLHREADEKDKQSYQTVYSKKEGAVAAPTAGLHFTEEVLTNLQKKNIQLEELTLHVSAGTFQPIKGRIEEHTMHKEQIIITKSNLEKLLDAHFVTAVGTTSMRTLESLYWYGILLQENADATLVIPQNVAYQSYTVLPSLKESAQLILEKMNRENTDKLIGETQIFIRPGYDFKVCNALITNFHQPKSTLILLVSAFTNNQWRTIYDYAYQHDFTFLSYGDSSILFR